MRMGGVIVTSPVAKHSYFITMFQLPDIIITQGFDHIRTDSSLGHSQTKFLVPS